MENDQVRKPDPKPSLEHTNLCDVWLDVGDHRCSNYWRVAIVLDKDTHVTQDHRGSMWGTYRAGRWQFCNMHARIFQRDRDDTKENHGKT